MSEVKLSVWQTRQIENVINYTHNLNLFNNPLVDIAYHIDQEFSTEELRGEDLSEYDFISPILSDRNFQQKEFKRRMQHGRLQIASAKEIKETGITNHELYLKAVKELGGVTNNRNYSIFAIRTFHSIVRQFPHIFELLIGKDVLLPIKSQTKLGEKNNNRHYYLPLFTVHTEHIFSWKSTSIDVKASEGAFVALLSKIR